MVSHSLRQGVMVAGLRAGILRAGEKWLKKNKNGGFRRNFEGPGLGVVLGEYLRQRKRECKKVKILGEGGPNSSHFPFTQIP